MKGITVYFVLIYCTQINLIYCNDLEPTIKCIEQYIQSLKPKMNQKYYTIFKTAYTNTLTTTIQHYNLTQNYQYTYIITGDIQAMWIRDSTNQFLPYLITNYNCINIRNLSKGLLKMQSQFLTLDTYTNAFKRFEINPNRPSYINDKTTTLIFGIPIDLCQGLKYSTSTIWQRKFQIDSIASFLRLSYQYYKKYQSIDFINLSYMKTLKRILSVLDEQIKDDSYQQSNKNYYYTFTRLGIPLQLKNSKIVRSGRTGLIKSGFRPSDDPNSLPYNIPSNAILSIYLKLIAQQILIKIEQKSIYYSISTIFKNKMLILSNQINQSIYKWAIIKYKNNQIFAYQIDGFGSYRLYDDANLPSLLSLPYFKFISSNNVIYINTRLFILSKANQYFYQYSYRNGIGSSHTPINSIWPLSIIVQILTSNSDKQILNCLKILTQSSPLGVIYQSFDVKITTIHTRNWFAWANSFYGEMITYLCQNKHHLLQ